MDNESVAKALEDTLSNEDSRREFAEAYMNLIDLDECDFIDDKTFRVHFKDGVNVDIVDEKIYLFEKEENLDADAFGVLLSAATLKRVADDMIAIVIKSLT